MTTRLAIFDFDGTLADTFALFVDSLGWLATRHHFRQLSERDIAKLRGLSAREILRELHLPLWRVPGVLADFRDLMRQRINEIRPFEGIQNALRTIADREITLALVTSNSSFNVEAVLGSELLNRFAVVECGTSLFGKACRLRRVLRMASADMVNAIYIGDELRDVHAARTAGIRFGAVAWGYTEISAMLPLQPDAIYRVPQDLLGLTGANLAGESPRFDPDLYRSSRYLE